MTDMTKDEALDLLKASDHCFLSEQTVHDVAKAFSASIKSYYMKASPHEPKGLTLYDGSTGAWGMDAADLAERVARHLVPDFHPWQNGRGFRLRTACEVIETHLQLERVHS